LALNSNPKYPAKKTERADVGWGATTITECFKNKNKKEDKRVLCDEPEVGRPRGRYYKRIHLGRYEKQPAISIQNTICILILTQSSNTGSPIIGAGALTPELGTILRRRTNS
jgi:hypothetical protein